MPSACDVRAVPVCSVVMGTADNIKAYKANQKRQHKTYERLVKRHGDSHKSLHWHSRTTQQERFKVLTRIGDLHSARILDIGCGIGDFAMFLKSQQITVEYTGYDIVSDALEIARTKCPKATFENRNILLKPPGAPFDYSFSSGLFAFGDQPLFEGILTQAVDATKIAFGFNIYQTPIPTFFSPDQDEILAFCRTLPVSDIQVVDDYLTDDLTFFLYK